MGKITNISDSSQKEWYTTYAKKVSDAFPDYDIIVDGGSYRGHDVSCEVNPKEKTIELDFYLPFYIDFEECFSFIKNTVINAEKREYHNSVGLDAS